MPSTYVEEFLKYQNHYRNGIRHAYDHLILKEIDASNIREVESQFRDLEDNWTEFKNSHQVLLDKHWQGMSDHEYVKMDIYGLTEEAYLSQKVCFLNLLAKLRRASADKANASAPKTAEGSSHIKLPRLQSCDSIFYGVLCVFLYFTFVPPLLQYSGGTSVGNWMAVQQPQFAGVNDDWLLFRDFFEAFVNDHASLSAVHKFFYLKASLKGEASQLIEYIPITDEGYSQAWKILTERYGNERLLMQRCLNAFTSMPKMKIESVSELERVYYGMLRTMDTLERLGRPVSDNSDLFVYLVVELFDMDTRREWETATWDITHEYPSLDTLKSFLQHRINVLKALSLYKPNPDSSSKKTKKRKKTFRGLVGSNVDKGNESR